MSRLSPASTPRPAPTARPTSATTSRIASAETPPSHPTLGVERAMTVSGDEGLDELSISGPTQIIAQGFALPGPVTPENAGLHRHSAESLRGGDAQHNADALRRLLLGEHGAYRDAVLLNAAAALIVAGEVADWRDGVEEAAEAIDKGLANALLACWIAAVR